MEKIDQIQVLPSGLLGTISREIGWGQTVKKVNWGGGGDLLCMQCLYTAKSRCYGNTKKV